MKKGLVVKSTGNRYQIRDEAGDLYDCAIAGKLRMKEIHITNPVAVGDIVMFEEDAQIGTIKEILPRKNYIIRKSSNLSKQAHILAANIDFAILVITIKYPETFTTFIDRFLLMAEAYRIPAVLLFNKVDLLNSQETNLLDNLIDVYKKIGYECYKISITKEINLEPVKNLFNNKICVISGHSGVGKSSLIKKIDPEINLKISAISDAHLKGKHTTTYYEMYALKNGGFIIDTPGIKGFGIVDIYKEEVYHFFPEFFKLSAKCQYNNCTHIHEPNCAVKDALEKGEAAWSRYKSYVSIINDNDGKHREKF